MISKESVDSFLEKERKSYGHMKRWSRGDVVDELKERGFPRVFVTRPRLHQMVCYLIGLLERRWLFFLGMSAGKTKLVLDLLAAAQRMSSGRVQGLVFVPKLVHMGTWGNQVEQHSDLTFRTIDETSITKKWSALLESDADVTVIDYQGFGLAMTKKVTIEGKPTLVRDDARVKALAKKYKFAAFDEVHRCRNWKTLRFSLLRQYVKSVDFVFGMTGTPHGRNPEDLWTLFYLVDGGDTLGPSLTMFRQMFFEERQNYFGGREYKFKRGMTEQLRRVMLNGSITYRTEECIDMPAVVPMRRTFRLPAEQRDAYNQLREGRMIDGIRVPTDGVFHRMREITSGYMRTKTNGVSVTNHFRLNPKLELLEECLLEIDDDCKFIIYYTYNPTGDMLAALMKRLRIKTLTLDGRTKDPISIESRLTNDDTVRGLLCNSESGSEGINGQRANVEIFYEPPVSPITRKQAEMRVIRDGQCRTVMLIDLVAERTVDDRILDFTNEGRNLLAELMRGSRGAQAALFGKG